MAKKSDLPQRLREMHAAKRPGSGIHGQMMGCEPYVLRASGNQFEWLIEAAEYIEALESMPQKGPKCEALDHT